MALESWFSEHVNFTHGPLQKSHFDKSKSHKIGHYTQVCRLENSVGTYLIMIKYDTEVFLFCVTISAIGMCCFKLFALF